VVLDLDQVVGRHLHVLEVAHVADVLFSGVEVLQLVAAEFADTREVHAHLHDIPLPWVSALPLQELPRLHSQILLVL
jgi:hypothetical protein